MNEIAPGIWRWTARHPEWHTRIEWGHEVASFALVGDALVLVDPLLPAPAEDGRPDTDRRPGTDGRPDTRADVERILDRLAGRATRLEIMITIPYHTRSAEELLARYRDALPTTIWGHRAVAKRFRDPATTLHEIEPGKTVGDGGALALAIGKPRRFEMPLFFPAHRALAFGDAVIGIDGGLRVWQQASTDPAWHERVFVPTMRPLLRRDAERVLTTHGDPVLHDGRQALEAALAAGPWDYRAVKD
jgi:hypothetical protein